MYKHISFIFAMAIKRKMRTSRRPSRYVKRRRFNMVRRKRVGLRPAKRLAIKRTIYAGNWTFGTAATTDFWRYVTFQASSINNFTEMAGLFDEYKINAVKITYRPAYDNVANLGAAGTLAQPQAYAHVLIDPASTLIPSGVYSSGNMNTFLENQGVRTYTLNRPFSVYVRPKVQDQLFGGSTSTRTVKPPYIKTTETAVDHRGFHMFLQQNNFANTNTNIRLDIFATYYITLRNIK